MRSGVRIAGLAAAAALALWCVLLAIRSFTSSRAGAALPRLGGGAGLQLLLGLAALVTAGLVVGAAFVLARPTCRFGRPFWLVVVLLGWAALAAGFASRAADLLLAPIDYEMGVGAGVTSTVAPAWQTWLWTVAAACAGLAGAVLVRRALLYRGVARAARPTH
jgi:hypothetical protein